MSYLNNPIDFLATLGAGAGLFSPSFHGLLACDRFFTILDTKKIEFPPAPHVAKF